MNNLAGHEYHCEERGVIYCGNCLDVMAAMEPDSVDTIITDPPYALTPGNNAKGGFMGKDWDSVIPGVPYWTAALRVAKPGATLLAFGGTRTHHRLWCAIEDAGWEIRDCLMWLYGSGFPKAADISKMIDKAAGAEREILDIKTRPDGTQRPNMSQWKYGNANAYGDGKGLYLDGNALEKANLLSVPATDAAKLWDGWKSALKPAWEPICLAMKPLDSTYAQNALKHGVAGLNIDGALISVTPEDARHTARPNIYGKEYKPYSEYDGATKLLRGAKNIFDNDISKGRYPSNLLLDEESARMLDEQSGISVSRKARKGGTSPNPMSWGESRNDGNEISGHTDSGGASRFFYTAKASRAERNFGCDGLSKQFLATMGKGIGKREHDPNETRAYVQNNHPTVKPLALIKYLCTLTATPTGGIVLDPFAGSGTTLLAAKETGRRFVGIDISEEYCEIAKCRLIQGVLTL